MSESASRNMENICKCTLVYTNVTFQLISSIRTNYISQYLVLLLQMSFLWKRILYNFFTNKIKACQTAKQFVVGVNFFFNINKINVVLRFFFRELENGTIFPDLNSVYFICFSFKQCDVRALYRSHEF